MSKTAPKPPKPTIVAAATKSPKLTPASVRRSPSPSPSPRRSRLLDHITADDIANFQRLHLIIDLDATFVSTHIETSAANKVTRVMNAMRAARYPDSALDELNERIFFFVIDGINSATVLRPGSFEFIEFASMYFKSVSVWSAGQRDYVEQIVSVLFPPHLSRPGVIFSWDDCKEELKPSSKKKSSPSARANGYIAFSKPMHELTRHLTNGADETNTLFLDDRSDIAIHNPKNLVQIPPYEPSLTLGDLTIPDYALEHLTEWLLRREVIHAKDVRDLDLTQVFNRDPQIPIAAVSKPPPKVQADT